MKVEISMVFSSVVDPDPVGSVSFPGSDKGYLSTDPPNRIRHVLYRNRVNFSQVQIVKLSSSLL